MSKFNIYRSGKRDSFLVSAATITTSWLPGQLASFSETDPNYVKLGGSETEPFGFLVDGPTELSAFPTGSKVTVVYGAGGKYGISHATEVAASSATRAYESDIESATPNELLYSSQNGKLTTTSSGSTVGILQQVPASVNNYEVIFISRI